MPQKVEFIVSPHNAKKRLDLFLSQHDLFPSRSYVKRLIDSKLILVNSLFPKAGLLLKEGDFIEVSLPELSKNEVKAEPLPLEILHEDPSIIVVNKPAGMVVHPAAGNYSGTLVNGLLFHCGVLSEIGSPFRPGIVHRLDKNTSGVLVVAKNNKAYQSLVRQFKSHTTTRRYTALACGTINEEKGTIASMIGRHPVDRKKMSIRTRRGKEAITHWKVLKRFGNIILLELVLQTGRTHQIRVHLASIHHPVLGDTVYGSRKIWTGFQVRTGFQDNFLKGKLVKLKRQALHASVLGFYHPDTQGYMEFFSPLPEDMKEMLDFLEEYKC